MATTTTFTVTGDTTGNPDVGMLVGQVSRIDGVMGIGVDLARKHRPTLRVTSAAALSSPGVRAAVQMAGYDLDRDTTA